jgi:hypothetical protein
MSSKYKKMEKIESEKIFHNSKDAFEYINSWTNHIENYNIRFQDKAVKEVKVLLENSKPVMAFVHYDNKKYPGIGMDTITFYDVLDKPKKTSPIIKQTRKNIEYFMDM